MMGFPRRKGDRAPLSSQPTATAGLCDNFLVTYNQNDAIPIDQRDRAMEWLVVRTKPRQERAAMSHLSHREVESYCPLYLEPKWNRKARQAPGLAEVVARVCHDAGATIERSKDAAVMAIQDALNG